MSSYTTTVDNNSISLTIDKVEHTLSLSRTGGQGSKGDTVTNVVINSNNEVLVTLTNAAGVETVVNAGVINTSAPAFVSDAWSYVDNAGVLDFRYNLATRMSISATGDLNVLGTVNANATFAAASSYANLGSSVVGGIQIFEESLTNALFFNLGGAITMSLSTTGDLDIIGSVNANHTF
jgi:hypothetical protein